jgi:hypothetical protein
MKFLLALSGFVLASGAQATATLNFESLAPGTPVPGFQGGSFIGPARVQSGGPTGNFLHLDPDSSFSLPTEAMQPLSSSYRTDTISYTERGFISSFDVMLPTGGTMLYGRASATRVTLAAGQWYHFRLWTPYIVKFHSAGGANLDNLAAFQTILAGQSPRRFDP